MKITFLDPSGQIGGAERSMLDVMASIRESEPDWELSLIVSADGPLVAAAREIGVTVAILPFPTALAAVGDGGARPMTGMIRLLSAGPAAVGYVRRMRAELRSQCPDVIHSNGFKMHVLAIWARTGRTPVLWHLHDFVRRRPLMSALMRSHASQCAALVANSRSVAADVGGVLKGKVPVHAVHNAVDLAMFTPDGPALDLDAAAGMTPSEAGIVKIGLVATLGWWKGHEVFLRALSLLPPGLPFRGYVVGGALYATAGSQRTVSELKQLARDMGIEGRVGFTGYIADSASAMRGLDVVVHASTELEPFGLVIAEGMATARAVVVSAAGGASELFTPGVDALGHPPGDAAELARQLESLVRDPELRARLAAAGRATAERMFDRGRLAREFIPIYQAVRESVP